MSYRQYESWGRKKLILDAVEPTHYVRNKLVMRHIKRLKQMGAHHVLEIGCGVGHLSKKMGLMGMHVDAFDLDKNAIELAKEVNNDSNVTFRSQNLLKYKPIKKYDMILMIEVLEHIEQDQIALEKVYTMLKAGGSLLITVPAFEAYRTDFDHWSGHIRRYTKEDLQQKLETAGFQVQHARYFGYPLLKFYYFNGYLRMARKKEKLQSGTLPWWISILRVLNKIFLLDLLFNSKKGINLIVLASKK